MPHTAVDWAALAQQWIAMGGGGPGPGDPPHPPMMQTPFQHMPRPPAAPPVVTRFPGAAASLGNLPAPPPPLMPPRPEQYEVPVPGEDPGHEAAEGGEANMELEDEDGDRRHGGWETSGWGQDRAWSSGSDSHSNSPFVNRNGSDWSASSSAQAAKKPLSPRSLLRQEASFSGVMDQLQSPGYKTGGQAPASAYPPSIPSLMDAGGQSQGMHSMAMLNDAQKKKLPSWIRAGLEKMERDKLKKEQEDERKRRFEERKRIEKLERAEELSKDPSKSKFDNANSDTEDHEYGDGDERNQKTSQNSNNFSQEPFEEVKQRKSRFEDKKKLDEQLEEDFDEDDDDATKSNTMISEPIQRSRGEILEEISTQLRVLLTTLLLEVTGEEIEQISAEVVEKSRNAPNSKPQLKTLLSGYGSDSASASENSDDEESEEAIKDSMARKKKDFRLVQSQILDYCAEETESYRVKSKKWLQDGGQTDNEDQGSKSSSPSREKHKARARSTSSSDSKRSNRKQKQEDTDSITENGSHSMKKKKERNRSPERNKNKSKKKARSRSSSSTSSSREKKRSKSRSKEKKRKKNNSRSNNSDRSSSRGSKRSRSKERTKKKHKKKERSRSPSNSSSKDHRKRSKSRSIEKYRKRKKRRSRSRSSRRSRSSSYRSRKKTSHSRRKKSRSRSRRSRSRSRSSRGRKSRSKGRRSTSRRRHSRSKDRRSSSRSKDRRKRSRSRSKKKSKSKSPCSNKKSSKRSRS